MVWIGEKPFWLGGCHTGFDVIMPTPCRHKVPAVRGFGSKMLGSNLISFVFINQLNLHMTSGWKINFTN